MGVGTVSGGSTSRTAGTARTADTAADVLERVFREPRVALGGVARTVDARASDPG